ncbi:MAG: hypothetical protein MI754_15800 [Chromatiales bacterium]|nr:hypothetical protein [Chromatiales bacterium]
MPAVTGNIQEAHSLKAIEQRRLLLRRVVAVARAVQQMKKGLKAVLFLGVPADKLPGDVRRFFKGVAGQLKRQSTDKVLDYIERLERLIKQDLDLVIHYSEMDLEQVDEIDLPDDTLNLLREFKRRAQTSVSLRMLLQKRGVSVPEPAVSLPVEKIRERLDDLETKEKIQRKKAVEQMRLMQEDLTRMMKEPGYTEEMKKVFSTVIAGLERDLKAIASGISLDKLPFSFEQVDNPRAKQPVDYIDPAAKPIVEKTAEQASEPQQEGFFKRLIRWLNTPWSVTWERIKRERRR